MTVIKVEINHWDDGSTFVSSSFDETGRVQAVLKSFKFRWNPDMRIWVGDLKYLDPLVAHLRHAGCFIDITEHDPKPPPPKPPPPRKATTDWASGMFAALSPELGEKVYRALSRVLHPDADGDGRQQQILNDAWSRMRPKAGAAR